MKYLLSTFLILAILFSVIPTTRADIYGSSLIDYWRLDTSDISGTSVTDRGANGNTGTLVNTPTAVIGKLAQAYKFTSASTQYITVTHNNNLDPAAITVSAWIYGTSFPGAYNSIVAKVTNNAGVFYYYSYYVTSAGKIAVYNAENYNGVNTSQAPSYDGTGVNTLSTGKWYHVAFTQGLSGLVGYVNGKVDGISALGIAFSTGNTAPLRIGSDPLTASREFNGIIDDVHIYNRVLTQAEIVQLYNQGFKHYSPF